MSIGEFLQGEGVVGRGENTEINCVKPVSDIGYLPSASLPLEQERSSQQQHSTLQLQQTRRLYKGITNYNTMQNTEKSSEEAIYQMGMNRIKSLKKVKHGRSSKSGEEGQYPENNLYFSIKPEHGHAIWPVHYTILPLDLRVHLLGIIEDKFDIYVEDWLLQLEAHEGRRVSQMSPDVSFIDELLIRLKESCVMVQKGHAISVVLHNYLKNHCPQAIASLLPQLPEIVFYPPLLTESDDFMTVFPKDVVRYLKNDYVYSLESPEAGFPEDAKGLWNYLTSNEVLIKVKMKVKEELAIQQEEAAKKKLRDADAVNIDTMDESQLQQENNKEVMQVSNEEIAETTDETSSDPRKRREIKELSGDEQRKASEAKQPASRAPAAPVRKPMTAAERKQRNALLEALAAKGTIKRPGAATNVQSNHIEEEKIPIVSTRTTPPPRGTFSSTSLGRSRNISTPTQIGSTNARYPSVRSRSRSPSTTTTRSAIGNSPQNRRQTHPLRRGISHPSSQNKRSSPNTLSTKSPRERPSSMTDIETDGPQTTENGTGPKAIDFAALQSIKRISKKKVVADA